jgi:hypothetical protein
MKRLMLAVAALTFSASATAQWIQIGETHDTVLFHALDTLRKEGNLRRVWEIQDFKSDVFGDGVRSLRYQSEYDCMGGRLRVLYLQAFKSQMATGEALNVPFNGGAPKTNRTSDLPLRRGLLYPLSYRGVARIVPNPAWITEPCRTHAMPGPL